MDPSGVVCCKESLPTPRLPPEPSSRVFEKGPSCGQSSTSSMQSSLHSPYVENEYFQHGTSGRRSDGSNSPEPQIHRSLNLKPIEVVVVSGLGLGRSLAQALKSLAKFNPGTTTSELQELGKTMLLIRCLHYVHYACPYAGIFTMLGCCPPLPSPPLSRHRPLLWPCCLPPASPSGWCLWCLQLEHRPSLQATHRLHSSSFLWFILFRIL